LTNPDSLFTGQDAMQYMPSPQSYRTMTTAELRENFLVEDLFQPGRTTLRMVDLDRVVLGGVVPTAEPIVLDAPESLAAEFFTERREIGVLNIGGAGKVTVDGETHRMSRLDGLYIGRGSREIEFASEDAGSPAHFYLVSYPAHAAHPTRRIAKDDAQMLELGTQEQANRRRLYKYFHPDALPTAQLVMGITEMLEGSVWNTMPSHTHTRRTEVYLYFDVPEDAVVFHFVGQPEETRNLVVRDSQVALSPAWSIHSGCGTRNYTFCWAMGGENQAFTDMQAVDMKTLR
jgi:4-deoxy-L-threo-5-hexosulose-uronate ketol-isomerase